MNALLVVFLTSNAPVAPAAEGDFNEGLDAYLVGNYAKALSIWAPLAESGDDVAAFNMGVLYAQGLGVEADAARAVRWYRQSAESGYAPAQFNLGSAYMQGAGVTADKGLAAHWWQKAAAQDYSHALFNLATLYLRGDGISRDENKARELYQRAAALGDLRAQRVLEQMVLAAPAQQTGSGAAPVAKPAPGDPKPAATSSAREAADRGDGPRPADARPPADRPKLEKPAAATGAPAGAERAATARGEQAVSGRGEDWLGRQDPGHYTVQVFAFSDLGAAQQYARAAGLAGELAIARASTQGRVWYKAFYGSYPDLAQARAARDRLKPRLGRHVPWIRRFGDVFAELADAPEAVTPAMAPARGADPAGQVASTASAPVAQAVPAPESAVDQGTAPPDQGALRQQSAAADPVAGRPPSGGASDQAGAAQSADAGREVPHMEPRLIPDAGDRQRLQTGQSFFNRQDYASALEAWRPLATKGIAQAQYGLGFMYESGWGVDRDYEQAFIWYERAARQGHAQSQYNLGMLFHNGLGVKRSEAKAFFWIQNAADGGDPRAGEYIQRTTSN